MKDLLALLAHLLTTLAKPPGPSGVRAVVADSLLMKQQLIVINRSRRRAQYVACWPDTVRLLVAVTQPVPHSASCRDYSAIDTIEIP